MDLATLRFVSDTSDLERASKVIAGLATDVSKLDKVSRDAAKTEETLAKAAKANAEANLANAKAQDQRLKSTITADKADQANEKSQVAKTKAIEAHTKASKENASILQRQTDIYDFLAQGFSKGQASILASAKATGQYSKELEQVLELQKQFTSDPFDRSDTGLKRLQRTIKEATDAQNYFNDGHNLTSKQAKELSNDLDRLNAGMKQQGKSYQEITKAQAIYKQQFIDEATAVNKANSALAIVEKQRKEVASAANYITQADQRMAAALNQANVALDKGSTDSLVRYEAALRKSGVSQELATTKLAKYKSQLEQVQKAEQARREQHLTRAIAPQASDVVVSLWSGQSPLTVLLQQGSQINDMFMLSGVAAERFGEVVKTSMKSMLPSILTVAKGVGGLLVDGFVAAGQAITTFISEVTLFTAASDKVYSFLVGDGPAVAGANWTRLSSVLSGVFAVGVAAAIASLVALGVALKQVTQEQNELVKSLNLTGAALGMSADSVVKFAQSLEGVKTTVAIDFIQELSNTSAKASSDLAGLTKVAVDLEKYGGVALKDTAKAYDELQKKPLEGLIKLAEGTGQVSKETIDLAIKLKLAGDEVGLLELANKQFVEANRKAVDSIKQQINPMTALWIVIKDGISSAWEGLKNFARTGIVLETVLGVIRGIAKGVLLVSTVTEGFGKTLAMVAAVISNISAKSPIESFNNIKSIISSYKEDMKDLGKGVKDSWGRINGEIEKSSGLTDTARASNSAYASDSIKGLNDLEKAWNSIEKSELKKITRQQAINKAIEDYTQKNKQASEWQLKLIEQGAGVAWDKAQAKRKEATSTLSVDKSNEIRILEDTYNRESQMQEKFLSDQLRIAKVNYEMGYMSKAEYLDKELQLIHASQAEQKALAEKVLTDREQLYVKEVNNLLTAYQKRIDANKNLKNSEQADAEALQHLTNGVQNAYRAYEAFNQKVKDKNEILASKVTAQETEAMKVLNDQVKKTTEAIAEYNRVNDLRIQQKKEDIATEDALRWATPEQAAVIRAMAEETKFYAAEISKFTKLAKAAKETLDDTINRFGVMSPQAQVALKGYNDAMNAVSQATADQRVAVEQAATDAIVKYQKDELKRYGDMLTDVIATTLFEGGKAGSKKLKDYLKTEFVIRVLIQPMVGNLLGSLFGSAGSAASGAGSSIMGSVASSAIGGSITNTLGLTGAGGILAPITGAISGFTTAATAAVQSMLGVTGTTAQMVTSLTAAGHTAAAGTAAGANVFASIPGWGWALAAVGALAAIFGKKSTPHTGAGSTYSYAGGLQTGADQYGQYGFADTRNYNPETEKVTSSIAKSVVTMLDQTAKNFGMTAGYQAATAFADDTSKDGAWGSLVIEQLGKKVIDWSDSQVSKWAPKVFSDGEKGLKEYMNAVANSAIEALQKMDLPTWASRIAQTTELGTDNAEAALNNLFKALSEYPNQLLQLFGTSRDALVEKFTEGLASGNAMQAGQSVADVLVESIRNALYTNAAGQIFDIVNQGIVAPVLDAIVTGASISEALSDASIQATIDRAKKQAQVLAELYGNTEFQAVLENLRVTVGSALGQAGTSIQTLPNALYKVADAAEDTARAAEELAQKEADLARKRLEMYKQIYTLEGKQAEARSIELQLRQLDLAAMDASLRPLQEMIYALEDFAEKVTAIKNHLSSVSDEANRLLGFARSNTDKAYAVLERSVGKQLDIARTAVETSTKVRDSLKGIFDLLSENIRALYGEVDSTSAMLSSEGRSIITQAISSGVIPEQDKLSEAISAVRSGLDKTIYSTKFQADKARLLFGIELSNLQETAKDQLTEAERQLKASEDTVKYLEGVLTTAKAQIDALRGIDLSVINVETAINNLAAAILAEGSLQGAKNKLLLQGTGQAAYDVTSGVGTNAAGQVFERNALIEATQSHLAQGTTQAALDVYRAAASSGYSMSQLETIYGLPSGVLATEIDKLSQAIGVPLPAFASGGMHSGGLRIVGENGPELEATGPARIWNAGQTATMLNSGSDSAEDIQALRAEVRAVVTHVSKLSRNIERLIVPTAEGEALQTKTVV